MHISQENQIWSFYLELSIILTCIASGLSYRGSNLQNKIKAWNIGLSLEDIQANIAFQC